MSGRRTTRFGALSAVLVLAVIAIGLFTLTSDEDPPVTPSVLAAAPQRGVGFSEVVSSATPSVVQVRSARGLGSGVVYDDAGHVVTNAHVVEGATRFRVTDADGTTHPATLSGVFPQGDLAVIDVEGAHLPPGRFADSSQVRTGDYALAIGNPLGLRSSVTMGIVSSTSRTVSEGGGVALPSVIQTSAPINPGNSGGALVDAQGAVIGVPTLAAVDPELGDSEASGIGFAISSNTVRSIVPQLIEHGRVLASGRAWLGVDLRTAPAGGTVVVGVAPRGPAADVGIRPGDMLERIGGVPTATVDDVAVALAQREPGAKVPVQVSGPEGSRTLQVTLGQTPVAK